MDYWGAGVDRVYALDLNLQRKSLVAKRTEFRQGGKSSKALFTRRETLESLCNNSKDRVKSFEILAKNRRFLTSLECAHLGLEIALKLILKHKEVKYPREHDLAKLAKIFLDKVLPGTPKSSALRGAASKLNNVLLDTDADKKCWHTSFRYALTEATEEHMAFAEDCHASAIELLEIYDEYH